MKSPDDFKLNNLDPEDFGDSLLKLEKSFGIKLASDSLKDAKTFGDVCDIIESNINLTHVDDCTTQQTFYKIRNAIRLTQHFDERNIEPQTALEDIFPRQNRRQNVKQFEEALGFPMKILAMKNWLVWALTIGFIISLVTFFFSWQYAVAGLIVFTLVSWVADKFSKELNILTVRELTEKISREHYLLARRQHGTMNRDEIVKTIQDVFIADHGLDRRYLTRDASLGW